MIAALFVMVLYHFPKRQEALLRQHSSDHLDFVRHDRHRRGLHERLLRQLFGVIGSRPSAQNQTISFIELSNYYSIWTYSLRDKKAAALIDAPGVTQHSSRFSPDGKWIAYTSIETGRFEVFVQPFPRTGAKFQITRQGGGHALWSPDGKEIFFDNNQQLFAVSVQATGTFSAGTPVALPIRGFIQGDARRQYDLMPDSKQFLMMFS